MDLGDYLQFGKETEQRMNGFVVRKAKRSDLPKIERHYGGPLDSIGDPFCDTTKLVTPRLDWLLVAEVDGNYAGFLYWHIGRRPFFSPRLEKFAHVREVQVVDDFRRKGVGKRLLTVALHLLKDLGVQEVFLSTSERNEGARKLYERLGFKEFRKQIQYNKRLN